MLGSLVNLLIWLGLRNSFSIEGTPSHKCAPLCLHKVLLLLILVITRHLPPPPSMLEVALISWKVNTTTRLTT